MKKVVNYQQNKYLTNYINWLKDDNISDRTIELYTQALQKFNDVLTTTNIRDYLKDSLAKYKVNTCKIYRQALSSYSKFKKLPVDWTKITGVLPKVQQKFFDTLDFAELKKIKQTRCERFFTNYQRNNLIIDFFLYSGLRVSELVNIKNCDFQHNQLKVLGKGNKERYVLIPPFLAKHFHTNSNAYLFTSLTGKQMLVKQVRRIIKLRTEKAEIKKHITPHSFRRSFATLLNSQATSLTTISKLLGHSNINTTANYIHNDYQTLYQDYSKLWKNTPNLSHDI